MAVSLVEKWATALAAHSVEHLAVETADRLVRKKVEMKVVWWAEQMAARTAA